MKSASNEMITSAVLVTLIYGMFIFSAAFRIKRSWKIIKNRQDPHNNIIVRKLDLVFSSIFLVASAVFYLIFLISFGR
jgi:hypothetical protein